MGMSRVTDRGVLDLLAEVEQDTCAFARAACIRAAKAGLDTPPAYQARVGKVGTIATYALENDLILFRASRIWDGRWSGATVAGTESGPTTIETTDAQRRLSNRRVQSEQEQWWDANGYDPTPRILDFDTWCAQEGWTGEEKELPFVLKQFRTNLGKERKNAKIRKDCPVVIATYTRQGQAWYTLDAPRPGAAAISYGRTEKIAEQAYRADLEARDGTREWLIKKPAAEVECEVPPALAAKLAEGAARRAAAAE